VLELLPVHEQSTADSYEHYLCVKILICGLIMKHVSYFCKMIENVRMKKQKKQKKQTCSETWVE